MTYADQDHARMLKQIKEQVHTLTPDKVRYWLLNVVWPQLEEVEEHNFGPHYDAYRHKSGQLLQVPTVHEYDDYYKRIYEMIAALSLLSAEDSMFFYTADYVRSLLATCETCLQFGDSSSSSSNTASK